VLNTLLCIVVLLYVFYYVIFESYIVESVNIHPDMISTATNIPFSIFDYYNSHPLHTQSYNLVDIMRF